MSAQNNIRYHSSKPDNTKPIYGEFDNVDFLLSAEGRNFVGGSFRLVGQVFLKTPEEYNILAGKTAYDGFVGAHSFIDRIDTSFQTTGNIENLSYYPRLESCRAVATLTNEDLFNSVYTCENRVPSQQLASLMLKGMVDVNQLGNAPTYSETFVTPLDFSLKLDFCLNNCIGNNSVPYAKTGDIRVKLTLARNIASLFGDTNIGAGIIYQLQNLKIVYQSVPDTGSYAPQYTMRVKTAIKTSLQSTYSNVSMKVPMVCDSFYATAILQSKENQPLINGMQNERIPNVAELQILWNDAMNNQITYAINNEEQILNNFIEAVNLNHTVGANNCTLNTLASNNGWGLGLSFGQMVDLSKTKFGINLTSGIQSGNPYVLYCFFSGIISISG